MSMEHQWNDTDRGNWSTGRKILHSVGGRWMNEYGALVEWYWQAKLKYWEKKHYTASVVDEWMGMDHWWNDTDSGNWSTGRKTLYSVSGWMNEWIWSIDGMVLTGLTEVMGEKHYTASVVDEWMSMEHWWNDTDRGNWSTVRKTLYSVGGRRMNEYGTLVEWYWQGKLKCWKKKTLYSLGGRWMNEYGALLEWYWQGKLKCWEKNILQRGWKIKNEYGTLVEWYWQGELKYWEKNIIQRRW